MGADFKAIARQLLDFSSPALPFVVQSSVSAAAFTAGLAATQLLGYACRVSCATPVLGSAVGVVGVGFASAMAGQASLKCQRYYQGQAPLVASKARRQDLLLDAMIGIALWKALGGRFRSVLPSDLFAPGAMAVESIPSPGAQYANEVSRGELARLFRRDGCHHCGINRGVVVGDHIPPNRMVWGSSKEVFPAALQKQLAKGYSLVQPRRGAKLGRGAAKKESAGLLGHWSARLRSALAIEPSMPKQRYFPQCKQCSGRQATAVRMSKRTLVLHFGGPKAPYYSGIIVGLRHFQALPPPSESEFGRGRSRRQPSGGSWDSFGLGRLLSAPAALGSSFGEMMRDVSSSITDPTREHTKFSLPTGGLPLANISCALRSFTTTYL